MGTLRFAHPTLLIPYQDLFENEIALDLMEQGGSHAGIVLAAQQQYSIGQQLRGLLKLAANTSAEAMVNRLVFLSSYLT
jgi:hypothetical protein